MVLPVARRQSLLFCSCSLLFSLVLSCWSRGRPSAKGRAETRLQGASLITSHYARVCVMMLIGRRHFTLPSELQTRRQNTRAPSATRRVLPSESPSVRPHKVVCILDCFCHRPLMPAPLDSCRCDLPERHSPPVRAGGTGPGQFGTRAIRMFLIVRKPPS